MFYFFLKFIFSLVIGNWVYSEAVLVAPDVETYAREFYENVRIPTHDEWPTIATAPNAVKLEKDLIRITSKIVPAGWGLSDRRLNSSWQKGFGWVFDLLGVKTNKASSKFENSFGSSNMFVSREESRRLFYIQEVGAFASDRLSKRNYF